MLDFSGHARHIMVMQVRLFLALVVLLPLMTGCRQSSVPSSGESLASPWIGNPAPSLDGALVWLNGAEVTLTSLRGKVVLLHFFDYSCINSIHTFPYLIEWERRYAPLGLQVIGIHSPQFDFGLTPANVQLNVNRAGLTHPIAVDSDLKIAGAYGTRYWPRLLLLDQTGLVRIDHTGEGSYLALERMIQKLLREINPKARMPTLMRPVHDFDQTNAACYVVTPELYLGHTRGDLGNPESGSTNAVIAFRLPAERTPGVIYAQGAWSVHDEYMRHAVDQDDLIDFLELEYQATELNVVMKPESIYWMKVYITIDGQPVPKDFAGADINYDDAGQSFVATDIPRLYNLTRHQSFGSYEVRLSVRGKGLSVYEFCFGTSVIPTQTTTIRSAKEQL